MEDIVDLHLKTRLFRRARHVLGIAMGADTACFETWSRLHGLFLFLCCYPEKLDMIVHLGKRELCGRSQLRVPAVTNRDVVTCRGMSSLAYPDGE